MRVVTTGSGRILVISSKFGPTVGGIETFAVELLRQLPPERIIAVVPATEGDAEFDATLPFPVVRVPRPFLSRSTAAVVRQLVAAHGIDIVWCASGAPMPLLAAAARSAGASRVVVSTHGHEVGFSRLPLGQWMIRRMLRDADVVTYLTEATRSRLADLVDPASLVRLPGGVDIARYRPTTESATYRAADSAGAGPIVISVSRLVRRKGQDRLIAAWPAVLRAHPGARLVIVGAGPQRRRLERLVVRAAAGETVTFTGRMSEEALPELMASSTVFVMPSRSRWGGVELEGLGLSALEAAASGLPVVVGSAGGAGESVLQGETGISVDGRRTADIADAVIGLLDDPSAAASMGEAGRRWTERSWSWPHLAARLLLVLDGAQAGHAVTLERDDADRVPTAAG